MHKEDSLRILTDGPMDKERYPRYKGSYGWKPAQLRKLHDVYEKLV